MTSRIEKLSSTRTLASGILWNGLGRGLPIIVALLCTPFLLHHLGIDRWGLFTLALSVAGSFGILDFGIGAALTRALAERIGTPSEGEAASLIVAALVVLTATGLVGALLGFFAAPAIMDRCLNVPPELRDEAVTAFRVLAAVGPLIIINAALWGVLSAYQSFRLATLANIPINIMYYVGPMAALLVETSLVWVIAALVMVRLVQVVVYGWLTLQLVPDLKMRPRFEARLLRPLLRIGAWVTVSNTLWPVMLYLDRFIVGAILSLAAVSYYATSLDLVMRLMMVPMAVAPVLFPAVAMSHSTMPERARALLRTGVLATIVVVFPPCLLLAGLAKQLLSLWLGAGFAAESQTVLIVFAIGMFFNCVAVLPATFTDAIGRPDIGAIIMLLQAVLFTPVIILLTTRYGIVGGAIAWTSRSLVNCAARLFACRWLGSSVAPVVPILFVALFWGAAVLIACPLIGLLPARLGMMAVAAIVVPLIAAAILLDSAEAARLRQIARKFLARAAPARPFGRI